MCKVDMRGYRVYIVGMMNDGTTYGKVVTGYQNQTEPEWVQRRRAMAVDLAGFKKTVATATLEEVRGMRRIVREELSQRRTQRSIDDMDTDQAKQLIAALQAKVSEKEKGKGAAKAA